MAGTRLLTQASIVLTVLLLVVPLSLYVHHIHRAAFPPPPSSTTTTSSLLPKIHIQVHPVGVTTSEAPALSWESISRALQNSPYLHASLGEALSYKEALAQGEDDALEGWFHSLSSSLGVKSTPATYVLLVFPPSSQVSVPKLTLASSNPLAWLIVPPSTPATATATLDSLTASATLALVDYLLTPPAQDWSPPELDYHLRFTLLNEQPEVHQCTWDFLHLQQLLHGEISRLSTITHIHLSADMMAYHGLVPDAELVSRRGKPPGQRYIPRSAVVGLPSHLPLHPALTFRESRHLELITLCPPPTRGHLSFYDDLAEDRGSPEVEALTLQVEGWGAVTLLDTTRSEEGSDPHPLQHEDYGRIGGAALGLLRSLLGLNQTEDTSPMALAGFPGDSLVRPPPPHRSVTDLELGRIMVSTTQARARKTTDLLQALADLLKRRPTIPFDDRLADKALEALRLLQERERGEETVTASLQTVTRALRLAQGAYFDPELVPAPVFPLEHLLAIYMPLIAPLVVPLVGGLVKEAKRYRTKIQAKAKAATS